MYTRQVPKVAPPEVRLSLIERAADMLSAREPVTVRALAERAGTSTMAVYTHFGGLDGLWRAVRQEGFTRLAERLARVERSADPVRDLTAVGCAYLANGLDHPALYRTMFDAVVELEDPAVADASFSALVECAARARTAERFRPETDPVAVATQYWAAGHGLLMLTLTGVLTRETFDAQARAVTVALCTAAGDRESRCRRSVASGWSPLA